LTNPSTSPNPKLEGGPFLARHAQDLVRVRVRVLRARVRGRVRVRVRVRVRGRVRVGVRVRTLRPSGAASRASFISLNWFSSRAW